MPTAKVCNAYLVIALEGPPELTDESRQEEFTDLGEFRIDDSHEGSKDGGKR